MRQHRCLGIKRAVSVLLLFALLLPFAACAGGVDTVTLPAPENLRVSDGLLRWDEVPNAIAYTLTVDEQTKRVTDCRFDLYTLVSAGIHTVTVTALGDGEHYRDSVAATLMLTLRDHGTAPTPGKDPTVDPGKDPTENPGEDEEKETAGLAYTWLDEEMGYAVSEGSMQLPKSGTLKIPATYNGAPVVAVTGKAFLAQKKLKKVIFPDTIRWIGEKAFTGCANLAEVVFPAGLREIGDDAFSSCGGLTAITFPAGLQRIGEAAFQDSGLRTLHFPDGNLVIEEWAFIHCLALTEVTFGQGVLCKSWFQGTPWYRHLSEETTDDFVVVGSMLLKYRGDAEELRPEDFPAGIRSVVAGALGPALKKKRLKKITFPDSVEYIDSGVLTGAETLEEVHLPAGLTVLEGCRSKKLRVVELPHALRAIGRGALHDIGAAYEEPIAEWVLPEGLESIGKDALRATNIRRFILPRSLRFLGKGAFGGCATLPSGEKAALPDLYYGGSAEEWRTLKNTDGWEADGIRVFFYSEAKPTSEGNYWHYVDGVPAAW